MPEPPRRTVVVGGGIAGLTAARELAATGRDVLVLEGSPRTGGKLLSGSVAGEDVPVGELVASRLGDEVVDRLVEPLLGGVYAGHARLLSARATVPQLVAWSGEASLVAAAAQAGSATPGPVFAGVEYASMAVVTLAFAAADLPDLPGSGFLVPPVDGRTIKAATFSFAKWDWVREAGDGLLVLRTSLGRHREESVLQVDDEDLVAA